jgi:hypothetical protein
MRVKVSWKRIIYILILLSPVVDTINGLYLLRVGATGVSLGTFYRLVITLLALYIALRKRSTAGQTILLLYFPFSAVLKSIQDNTLTPYLTYAVKWIYPVLLVYMWKNVFRRTEDTGREYINKIIDFWLWFVPLSLITEYLLKLGYITYYDAGYKGLYYSTNDIAFLLTVLFIYSVSKVLHDSSKKNIIQSLITLIAIVILGTKSCLIFAVVTFVTGILYNSGTYKKLLRNLIIIAMGILAVVLIARYSTQFNNAMIRYSNMWSYSTYGGKVSTFLNFATSGRTPRINSFFTKLTNNFSVTKLLFGWITPDNAHVIEMDWHDLLCQYGVIGLAVLVITYLRIFVQYRFSKYPGVYALIVGMIYTTLSGHIISGALAGTALAVVIIDSQNRNIGYSYKALTRKDKRAIRGSSVQRA